MRNVESVPIRGRDVMSAAAFVLDLQGSGEILQWKRLVTKSRPCFSVGVKNKNGCLLGHCQN